VTRKGKTIHLTSKEYAILEYLLRHKNQYISEGELIDKIWDSNYEGMSNTVAVHVKNLKNKVDKKFVFEKQLISSERNKGYILNG
jgi:DNA-binding response OmpR family regulator